MFFNLIKRVFTGFLAFLLSSCSLFPDPFIFVLYKPALAETFCSNNCWLGIKLGKSTFDEAYAILSKQDFVSKIDVYQFGKDGKSLGWNSGIMKIGGTIYFRRNGDSFIASYISMQYLNKVKIKDIIEVYGEPSHASSNIFRTPEGGKLSYRYDIRWQTAGVYIIYDLWSPDSLNLDWIPNRVYFYEQNHEMGPIKTFPGKLVRWEGIKNFVFYCRDQLGNQCVSLTIPNN